MKPVSVDLQKHMLQNHPSIIHSAVNRVIKSGLILGCVMLVACVNQRNNSAPIESVQNESNNQVNTAQPALNNTASQSFPLPAPPMIEASQTINLQNANGQVDANIQANPSIQNIDPAMNVDPTINGTIPASAFGLNAQPGQMQNGGYTIAANSPITINAGTTDALNMSTDIALNSIGSNTQSNNTNWQQLTDQVISQVLAEGNISFTNQEVLFVNNVSNQAISTMPVFVIDQLLNQRAAAITNAKVADQQAVLAAKQQLGIAANDTLLTRSKAIAIARQLNARYTLYPIVTGSEEAPVLTVQLINASTAEIIAEANSK